MNNSRTVARCSLEWAGKRIIRTKFNIQHPKSNTQRDWKLAHRFVFSSGLFHGPVESPWIKNAVGVVDLQQPVGEQSGIGENDPVREIKAEIGRSVNRDARRLSVGERSSAGIGDHELEAVGARQEEIRKPKL